MSPFEIMQPGTIYLPCLTLSNFNYHLRGTKYFMLQKYYFLEFVYVPMRT